MYNSFLKTCLITLKNLFQITTLQNLAYDEYLYPVLLFRFLPSLLFVCTGMDAQVAYGFHHLRNEKPHLAQGPISNKVRPNISISLYMNLYMLIPLEIHHKLDS